MAYYVCKYNMSFNFAAKLPNIIKNIAFDSKIIQDLNISRKKL